jgi:hypothetical protein
MSGVRSLTRRASVAGYASAGSAPIYVNTSDNSVRVVPGGSGTGPEVSIMTTTLTGAAKTAYGSGALVSGTATVATGLTTVASFQASIYGATGFATGATEVSDIIVSSITTGSVVVKGTFTSFVTGATTISVSGTATFYWVAAGT